MPNPPTDDPGDPTIAVMIVDDHEVVSMGLRALLDDTPNVHVVAVARSVAEARTEAARHAPDVVLMDFRLPDGNGADCAKQLRSEPEPPNVVMITSVADRRVLGLALDAGCVGFVSKNADRADLVSAVESAAKGETYFTRDVLKHLVHLRRFEQVDNEALSDREVEVLQATADGQSVEEIAAGLFLSVHTVKNHLRNAMGKLDAHTKLEAVVKAVRARIITIDD